MTLVCTRAPAGLDAGEADYLEALAAQKRSFAAGCSGNPQSAAQARAEAAGLEALAAALRDPDARGVPALRQGRGGEIAPPDDADMPGHTRELAQAVASSPGMLAADASLTRLGLARDAGALALAVETAQDARAETATEKMLAHQLAAAHALAMRLLSAADSDLIRHERGRATNLNPNAHTETVRSASAAARLMESFARGALVLDRLRNGGRHFAAVQHVIVVDGGKTVVAGSLISKREVEQ